MRLLSAAAIKSRLQADIDFVLLPQTDSTNDWLLRSHRQNAAVFCPRVCIAERQSAGRGTRGRGWHSPGGCNLYCSLLWCFAAAAHELGGLSLAVGVAVCSALERLGVGGLKIKWPNDLYATGEKPGKLGGVLIDVVAQSGGHSNGHSDVVIGVGLNIGMSAAAQARLGRPVADVCDWPHAVQDRNVIAAAVIDALVDMCAAFARHGFAGFRARWARYDLLAGQYVRLILGPRAARGEARGVARGVNGRGMLLVEGAKGLAEYAHGEVSLEGLAGALPGDNIESIT